MTSSILPILFAGVVCGWAFLTLVGGEKTRRTNSIEATPVPEPVVAKPTAHPPAKTVAAPAVQAKPAPPPKPAAGKH